MGRDTFLLLLLILIWVLVFLHVLAELNHLYWVYWWFDYLTHGIGGLWVGLAALWFRHESRHGRKFSFPGVADQPLLISFCAALAVGIVWEFYEYVVWHLTDATFPQNYLADTAIDLGMDVAGAFVGAVLFSLVLRRNRSTVATKTP